MDTEQYRAPDSTARNRDRQGKLGRSITSVWRTGIIEEDGRETGEVEIHLTTSHDKDRKCYSAALTRATRFEGFVQVRIGSDSRGVTYAPVSTWPAARFKAADLETYHHIAEAVVRFDANPNERVAAIMALVPAEAPTEAPTEAPRA